MVLEELGLDYEIRAVDIAGDQHRRPDFLRLNPAGFVPVLVTPDGEALHETAAIMLWLAERYQAVELAPMPGDPLRGRFLSRLFHLATDLQPAIKRVFHPYRYSDDPAAASGILASAQAAALDRWGLVDRYLAQHGPWNLGARFSLTDLYMSMEAGFGLIGADDVIGGTFPALRRCFEGVLARPAAGPILAALRRDIGAWHADATTKGQPGKRTKRI